MKWIVTSLLLALFSNASMGQTTLIRSQGQTLYLSIYSHIWHGDMTSDGHRAKTLVSVSVGIRNTDPLKAIHILAARYYDTHGKKLKEYVPTPKTIPPMGTYELFVSRGDDTGGSGANFLITWTSDAPASQPIVEGIHANLPVGRAIVFTSAARALPND